MSRPPAAFEGFPRDTVTFLRALARHNTEAWMTDNRARYQAAILTPARQAVVAVGNALHEAGCRVVAGCEVPTDVVAELPEPVVLVHEPRDGGQVTASAVVAHEAVP